MIHRTGNLNGKATRYGIMAIIAIATLFSWNLFEQTGTSKKVLFASVEDPQEEVVFDSDPGGGLLKPVIWEYSTQQEGPNQHILLFKASIEKGWTIYSQYVDEGGPIPTSFRFDPSSDYELVEETQETGRSKEGYDNIFMMDVKKFYSKAIFRQKIKLKGTGAVITGELEFMSCDDTQCLPPDQKQFTFVIGDATAPAEGTGSTDGGSPGTEPGQGEGDESKSASNEPAAIVEGGTEAGGGTPWGIFWAGMIAGMIALLTPCVFPMIPLTVSFFTKQSKNKTQGVVNGLVYAISIVVIFVGPVFGLTLILGPATMSEIASSMFFNLLAFAIFLVFAISFFGAFEITLPTGFVNKMDSYADKGGFIGIFFMALTLALVSFSCTGGIVGGLLFEAAARDSYLGPLMGLLGFGLAFALPFGLFATFPGWMNSLPQSGGWLNAVKVSLGFIELAFAMKFLSNVDLAYHWGFLKREIFLAIWVVIFAMWGFYLLGKLKFAHDSDLKFISTPRLFIAVLSFSFAFYLVPGMWGAPLSLLSGLQPPAFYTIWEGGTPGGGGSSSSGGGSDDEHVASVHCPHNLNCFHDYDQGMAYAKEKGKPVLLDFTGWTCVNCRKMEENVWIKPEVMKYLRNNYVLISLYVDDKQPLPEEEQVYSEVLEKKMSYVGHKWHHLQLSRFNRASQPWYVLLDNDGNQLVGARGYTPDVKTYADWLQQGVDKYNGSGQTAITMK
jgi:thiol:disulfide interchange protein DsbD